MNKKIAIEIIFFGIVVSIFHQIALAWYLYWTVSWYDIPMHFAGGFLMGLLVLLIVSRFGLLSSNPKINFTLIFMGVMIIGLGWELFEIFAHMTDIQTDLMDTLGDLFMDAVGAVTAFYYTNKKYLKTKTLSNE